MKNGASQGAVRSRALPEKPYISTVAATSTNSGIWSKFM